MARKKPATTTPPMRWSARVEKLTMTKEAQKSAAIPNEPKRFRRPRQRKGCRLLNLPGELRNRIYELALVDDGPLEITSKGPSQPSLLRTCRRVRADAGTIYYGRNEIHLMIEDYNGADFVPFARQARAFDVRGLDQDIGFIFNRNGRNWDNLVAWIKAFHTQRAFVPDWNDPDKPLNNDGRIVAGAFNLAAQTCYWSWVCKEKALKTLYETLRGTFCAWVKDEDEDSDDD